MRRKWLTRLAAWTRGGQARSSDPEHLSSIAQGGPVDGVRWTILAGPDPHHDDGFMTLVARERAGHRASSGMGGPKLPAGQLVNTWHGSATSLPPFVLLRADPSVAAVTVHTARDHHLPLDLTEPVKLHGLRFAAGPLADGDAPVELTVGLADGTSFTGPYHKPRRPET